MTHWSPAFVGLSLLAQVHFAFCLRPEQFQKAVEEASAKTVEPDKPTLYCCHDWVAKKNKCYPHNCPSANDLPLLASGFCPPECCSEARGDCPPSDPSFLEEGSTGQAETEGVAKKAGDFVLGLRPEHAMAETDSSRPVKSHAASAMAETETTKTSQEVCCGSKTMSGASGNNFCSSSCFTPPTSAACPHACQTRFKMR
eukprot:CAMPEP_0181435090 /NCGR_PEP_ID=MMETSP1110-20121109/20153_1 /TAXON_ID=174948 /ORGANISM="Symbiodinium sp., Strain CCMP421" /LENGTH=198 /DNA_ID=CAMNT_0023558613 /DNA_START=60 /DNA_END=656 /DNA_ORIENTATION=+